MEESRQCPDICRLTTANTELELGPVALDREAEFGGPRWWDPFRTVGVHHVERQSHQLRLEVD